MEGIKGFLKIELGIGAHACNLVTRKVEAKVPEFKVILCYLESLGPAWDTQDYASKSKVITKIKARGYHSHRKLCS